MRLIGSRNAYDLLPNVEAGLATDNEPGETNELPPEPPEYDNLSDPEAENEDLESMDQMDVEEPLVGERLVEKVYRFRDRFIKNTVRPVKHKIVDPLAQLLGLLSDKIDFYLNKVGNPLILRRFFYIFMMSAIAYMVLASGFIPNERTSGYKGMFSDHDVLMKYARASVDLPKFERDLEYLSSMPHMSGTKGDSAIRHFVEETMNNNRLKTAKENEVFIYSTYPEEMSLKATTGDESFQINVTTENFNPLATSGELRGVGMIYGNMGTLEDLQRLKNSRLLDDDFILLIHYGELVSEQVLIAEKFGAKGVLFITDKYGEDVDVVQSRSVGIPQYWAGTPMLVGTGTEDIWDMRVVPKIPTIPLSWRQGTLLLSLLSKDGVPFGDDRFSGKLGDVHLDMLVKMDARNPHPAHNIIGKIEGREQNDKAIIIAASRTSVNGGANYPSFGTTVLLSLIQLFQELKYKYDWRPLRSIYFLSYGGTEFNFGGSAVLTEQKRTKIRDSVYCMLDISQLELEVGSQHLNIQAHPLLHQFFSEENEKMGFDISVEHVKQYGDWTPLMAKGIPVTVLSSPKVLKREPPIESSLDTFESTNTLLQTLDNREALSDLILYVLQSSLKLADSPFVPFDISWYVRYVDRILEALEQKHSNKLNFQDTIKALLTWKGIGEDWSAWNKGWQNIVFSREEGIEPSLISVHRWTWNKKLSNIGWRQCIPDGLRNRPYYKHVLFGPSFWTQADDDSWTFPGVRDAIKEDDWEAAQQQLDTVAHVLAESAALFLEETTDVGN